MNILSLDTSNQFYSVAIYLGKNSLEYSDITKNNNLSVLITHLIEKIIAEAGLSINQIDALAFGCGPGTFSGIRTTVGIVQGLAFALDIPVMPVSTLAALAFGAIQDTQYNKVAVAINARMNEIYWGTYILSGNTVKCLTEDCVCAPESIYDVPQQGTWLGVGDGWIHYSKILLQKLHICSWFYGISPLAGNIAKMAAIAPNNAWLTAMEATPVYLRNIVAKKYAW